MLTTQPAMAQEEFEDDVEDVPAAPINDYILVGVLAGGLLGLSKMQRGPASQQ
ncbi:MAG: hypothetical protein IR153_10815 [Flavobacterium sp.]|nr:hypothetical protein [Flavobacterium sp.]